MNKLLTILLASTFAVVGTAALAADPPKEAASMKKAALEKPANVTPEAWAKMTDAEKTKAVEAAKAKPKETAATKGTTKEKKGGC